MKNKERKDGNNAERDDDRGVNRKSFGPEEAPSARTRAAGLKTCGRAEAESKEKVEAERTKERDENRERTHSSRSEAGAGLKRSF